MYKEVFKTPFFIVKKKNTYQIGKVEYIKYQYTNRVEISRYGYSIIQYHQINSIFSIKKLSRRVTHYCVIDNFNQLHYITMNVVTKKKI